MEKCHYAILGKLSSPTGLRFEAGDTPNADLSPVQCCGPVPVSDLFRRKIS